MRVIAGEHKGRALKAVPNQLTRPTTDKVKESLFQVLGPFFEGGACLDLFAGSGGLGIEALSRGMDTCIFVDKQGKAVETIHQNLTTLKLSDAAEVYRNDAMRALKAVAKREKQFDLIFLDPPYQKVSYESLLEQISETGILGAGGQIVCEHDGRKELPEYIAGFQAVKRENYGNTTAITIYQAAQEGAR
ncbi:16S rRNA (guanine(966)-N(2))-methyltransferase RsmD [Terribacillus aidingensis]|uniref:16S rRNA (Guanine(966)-N(2))-methyltransferase RsmD n=1 Tax=Terribacillus aidingensis TaxID=586416 RepID=A0A285NIK6_9BACI|nr:16S rRNA (guanine(966)-N(2))-methyltransferase RsmD [Terribacillus aidingensis]SNZ09320.1 16S rRNA (guanine(966)-N(2))-methyltransferase RsmD [Terribacillus aidingensis]